MSLRRVANSPYHSKVRRILNFSRKFAGLAALAFLFISTPAQQTETATLPFNAAAYRVGERLTYDVSFAQFVSAAHVELFVAGRGKYFDREGIQLRAHVETSGVVNVALLGINNDYTTFIDVASGLPYRSQQVVREAGRTSEASSDYNQPAGAAAIPAKLHTGEFPGTFDLLSAIYRLRGMPLSEGSAFSITVRNEAQEYQANVQIIDRTLIKTNVGSFNTLVAKVNAKNSRLDNIRIYLSEDQWHVPVLITAKHSAGEMRAELAASELTASAPPTATPCQQITPRRGDGTVPATSTTPAPTVAVSTVGAPLNFPFKVGEQLNYQISLGNTA